MTNLKKNVEKSDLDYIQKVCENIEIKIYEKGWSKFVDLGCLDFRVHLTLFILSSPTLIHFV